MEWGGRKSDLQEQQSHRNDQVQEISNPEFRLYLASISQTDLTVMRSSLQESASQRTRPQKQSTGHHLLDRPVDIDRTTTLLD